MMAIMQKKFSGLLAALMLIGGCSIKPDDHPGGKNGRLKPCPESPNCVSTLAHDDSHTMPPLPFIGTKAQSKARIIEIIKSMERSKIILVSDSYIHAEFRSRFFRFVDDVEFLFDDAAHSVHFRSASRVGYSDFGVNRRRMRAISKRYLSE